MPQTDSGTHKIILPHSKDITNIFYFILFLMLNKMQQRTQYTIQPRWRTATSEWRFHGPRTAKPSHHRLVLSCQGRIWSCYPNYVILHGGSWIIEITWKSSPELYLICLNYIVEKQSFCCENCMVKSIAGDRNPPETVEQNEMALKWFSTNGPI